MTIITSILSAFSWLANPKNRSAVALGLIILLIILLIGTCSRVSTLEGEAAKSEQEITRVKNNEAASRDSVTMMTGKNGELVGKISGYELTVSELESDYGVLLGKYEIEKGKPPVVITKIVTVIKDSTIYVAVGLEGDSVITVNDTSRFTADNWRILTGRIPYEIDTALNQIKVDTGVFSLEQAIALQTVLTREKKTGKIQIQVITDYPGVTFSRIQGAVIQDDKENAKVLRQARKEWGIGVHAGYGAMLNLMDIGRVGIAHGPYIGVGIHWSPRWAQWGK